MAINVTSLDQNVRLSFYKLVLDSIASLNTLLPATSGSIVRKVTNQAIDYTVDDGGIIDTILEIQDRGDGSALFDQFGEVELYLLLVRTKEKYGSRNKLIRDYYKQAFNFSSKSTFFWTQFPRYRFDLNPTTPPIQGKYEIRQANKRGFQDYGSDELKQKGMYIWGIELALINLSTSLNQ